jgi:pimeloyl-ACP methyl ester carboxylesterase
MNMHDISTHDGRTLHVVEAACHGGVPVLMHHGTPSAGIPFAQHVRDADAKGIRLLAYDRPGYGQSTRHPGYSMADTADDVRSIADALGLDRLAVWGMSGGGPHALACAALLGDRVAAVGVLASPAPFGAPGLDYFAGMGEANVEDIKLMLEDEAAAHAGVPADREATLSTTPETMVEAMASLMSTADASAFTHEFAEWIVGGTRAGLAPDGEGWWDDGIAQLQPWIRRRVDRGSRPALAWDRRQVRSRGPRPLVRRAHPRRRRAHRGG